MHELRNALARAWLFLSTTGFFASTVAAMKLWWSLRDSRARALESEARLAEVRERLAAARAAAQREQKISEYLLEMIRIDRQTPNGLKSVKPGPGDDPVLVEEAWKRFVEEQKKFTSGGSGRFA